MFYYQAVGQSLNNPTWWPGIAQLSVAMETPQLLSHDLSMELWSHDKRWLYVVMDTLSFMD